MTSLTQQRLRLSGGTELSFITAGDASNPALLLLHGFPSSSRTFQGIIPGLARVAFVIPPTCLATANRRRCPRRRSKHSAAQSKSS
ncbi:hypothetical protein [Mesorhizobium sp.]|uniref:alpha/beta fold hydrolase n=1 Tax=Mesorhizobium sp. TaxID=1871066 RepID=UPI00257B192B|nr:hypothetical protein [Mesorhizobium sp.]